MSRELNENEKQKVEASFAHGVEKVTKDDLEKVMSDEKTAQKKASSLGKQFGNFVLLWQLLKDYWNNEYTKVPWKFIAAIVFAVGYLVSPFDIIPDFIPIIGFVDDASVFALVVKSFESEINDYKQWKDSNDHNQLS